MEREARSGLQFGGLTGLLLKKLHNRQRTEPRLALLERITLAPRQSLALVEAEGRRILVATSAEGGPAFYPLEESARLTAPGAVRNIPFRSTNRAARVSW